MFVAMKILVVDDDRDLVDVLTYVMQREGFSVIPAYDGDSGWRRFQDDRPSLVLLDINMPGVDGIEVCRRIRVVASTPVVMLTARTEEADIVRALGIGADDYVTKPFSPRQLLARVKAVLRRASTELETPTETKRIEAGELALDLRKRSLSKRGEDVHLTPLEFKIVAFLLRNQGRVMATTEIVEQVWGYVGTGNEDLVKVHIHRLRQKIEDDPQNPTYVRTVPFVGYMVPE
jgi:DNA-binding response OmpR family regulator